MSVDERRRIFSKWLTKEMKERGWSQSDLARASNLNRAVINKIVNINYQPYTATLIAISHGLNIPVEASFRAAGLLPQSLKRTNS
jgi:transcriptional regulator with XRE-family HTH domain